MKDSKGEGDKRETIILFSRREIVRATSGYYKCGIFPKYLQRIRKINYTFQYKFDFAWFYRGSVYYISSVIFQAYDTLPKFPSLKTINTRSLYYVWK